MLSVKWTCVKTCAASLALVYQSLKNIPDVKSLQKPKLFVASLFQDSKLIILKITEHGSAIIVCMCGFVNAGPAQAFLQNWEDIWGFGHFDWFFRGLGVHVCVCEGEKFANENGCRHFEQNLFLYFWTLDMSKT